MLGYYQKTFILLLHKIKEIQRTPYKNRKLGLVVQEILIKKITLIESKIKRLKNEEIFLKRSLRNRPSKDEAKQIKLTIKANRLQKEKYEKIIYYFKNIGDSLAFIYLDRWDIKPLSFKESCGFISGKKGSSLERKCLREVFKRGGVAILNDITNSLRYADITIVKYGLPLFVELKTSQNQNERTVRQNEKIKKIANYLLTDTVKDLYTDDNTIMQRKPLKSVPKILKKQINLTIDEAKKQGSYLIKAETGLYYFATYGKNFNHMIPDNHMKNPFLILLNDFKFEQTSYYPFSLTFDNPETIFDFYHGRLVVGVLIDMERLPSFFRRRNFDINWHNDSSFILSIHQNGEINPILKVSHHFFNRFFMEAISFNWWMNEVYLKTKEIEKMNLDCSLTDGA